MKRKSEYSENLLLSTVLLLVIILMITILASSCISINMSFSEHYPNQKKEFSKTTIDSLTINYNQPWKR